MIGPVKVPAKPSSIQESPFTGLHSHMVDIPGVLSPTILRDGRIYKHRI